VLVSAFASRALCSDLFEVVLLEHNLVRGRNVVRELTKALRHKIKLATARSEQIIEFVSGEASQIVEQATPISAPVNPDDALVLA
jgi:hypothetical protein